jgi:hypothetical protein
MYRCKFYLVGDMRYFLLHKNASSLRSVLCSTPKKGTCTVFKFDKIYSLSNRWFVYLEKL